MSWITIALLAAPCGCAADNDSEGATADTEGAVVGGDIDSGHEEVVRVSPVGEKGYCTGTLIGVSTVLTAAHCVYDDVTQQARPRMKVEVPNRACPTCPVTFAWAEGDTIPPPVQFLASGVDIALIHLDSPTSYAARASTPGVEKSLVNLTNQPITLVGFGVSDIHNPVYDGDKRWGRNWIDSANDTHFYYSGVNKTEATACAGDSGGPVYAGGYTSTCLLGVTSHEEVPYPYPACAGRGRIRNSRLNTIPVAGWILANADPSVTTCRPYQM